MLLLYYAQQLTYLQCNIVTRILVLGRDATAKLSKARTNILPQFFLTCCFLLERIETQNLGKAQALVALPAVAALLGITDAL